MVALQVARICAHYVEWTLSSASHTSPLIFGRGGESTKKKNAAVSCLSRQATFATWAATSSIAVQIAIALSPQPASASLSCGARRSRSQRATAGAAFVAGREKTRRQRPVLPPGS